MKTKTESTTEYRLAKDTDCTVLITGATGTGKSYLASKIHRLSSRALRPFIAIQLSSLHDGTIESRLFGHERGAFTGAVGRSVGWLQKAEGGTLFLDEIAELSMTAQARLLEFLQTKQFAPLGSSTLRSADVRIICATNRDLKSEVAQGRFREDLYHRMRVVSIDLPPLRDSVQSLDETVHEIVAELSATHSRRVSRIEAKVAELLESYDWPGNYRELRNVLEFALLASRDFVIRESDLPSWFVDAVLAHQRKVDAYFGIDDPVVETIPSRDSQGSLSIAKVRLLEDYDATMRNFERAYLRHALESEEGHLSRAASAVRLPKSTFSRRAQILGIRSHRSKLVSLSKPQENSADRKK